ncbi:MAG TPA: polysaccharide deacetylase family protein [Dehalococcoidia bacterium]|nr:polysaccharide deacetylase family protein [Dehalococcoidia bacterium]
MSIPHGTEDNRAAAAGPPQTRVGVALQTLAWCGAGAVAAAPLAIIGAPVNAHLAQAGVALVIAAIVVAIVARLAGGRALHLLAVPLGGVAAWLLAQASYPAAAWIVAPLLGAAVAFSLPDARSALAWRAALPPALVAGVLVLLRLAVGRDVTMAVAAASIAVAVAAGVASARPIRLLRGASLAFAAVLTALVVTSTIGATTPGVTWFGSLIHHGPRNSNQVAVTFDDGPDPPYTLQVKDILDRYGVKATFFTVGKALDARPDVSRALLDDGMLLGNHSYYHDAWRWLDPRYPELQRTQDAFKRNLGVCPALYRPPHGTHTPFMARVVSDHHMKMVTWDVSAADWATHDSALVARRVLEKVKPGSIIDLHDGLDGNIGADRSVVVAALPIILDGLRARGLQPVTLDRLLGTPGYLPSC